MTYHFKNRNRPDYIFAKKYDQIFVTADSVARCAVKTFEGAPNAKDLAKRTVKRSVAGDYGFIEKVLELIDKM